MAVTTPSYWEEEKYQPLVEAKTAYGNKVKIPEHLLDLWKYWEERRDEVLADLQRAKAAGYFNSKPRSKEKRDLQRVYFELYHEQI